VSQIPNLAKLGTHFLLQGGTQHNLAAVKSQVDFIKSRFKGTDVTPEVIVHKFCGEAGAIGCAVEAHRMYTESDHRTSFIGLDRVQKIEFRTTRSEATRCYFCKNKCLRTFIDVKTGDANPDDKTVSLSSFMFKQGPESPHPSRLRHGHDTPDEANAPAAKKSKSKVPLLHGEERLIIATCEKGTVEDVNDMRDIKKGLDEVKKANPNFAEIFATQVFRPAGVDVVADAEPKMGLTNFLKRREIERRAELMKKRGEIRIGLVRALNMYSMAPWFMAYFEALGIAKKNLIWSDYTSEEMYKEGAKRGSIDPCFPSKIGIPHAHNLLFHKHSEKQPLNYIFFPMIDCMPTFLEGTLSKRACPTVTATPEAVKAAFTKESNVFADRGIEYLDTFVNFSEPALLARQMFDEFKDKFGLSREENDRACRVAWDYYDSFHEEKMREARELLDRLERNNEIGVVLLTRPYHNDPGVCHEIPDEFQKIGIPVFTMDCLPRDPDILERLFAEEVERGDFASALSIEDAWKNAYSENTNRKVWAAKYAARHPNLVALELSSFKCGHDAPIYTVVEEVVENSGTPYFCFKDIDENKPTGSIKIRTETIGYFLKRYQEDMRRDKPARARVAERMRQYQTELLARIEAAQQQVAQAEKVTPDVLLNAAGLRPKQADVRYANLHQGKKVNAAQSQVLNKTAGAHRGAEMSSPDEFAPAEPPPAE
jgi:predicted nucleotide-binding protein (sugar kinase/HSP70/actin superfamily)